MVRYDLNLICLTRWLFTSMINTFIKSKKQFSKYKPIVTFTGRQSLTETMTLKKTCYCNQPPHPPEKERGDKLVHVRNVLAQKSNRYSMRSNFMLIVS